MTQLRSVTCHMGSHSVTCYLTLVTASQQKTWPAWHNQYHSNMAQSKVRC